MRDRSKQPAGLKGRAGSRQAPDAIVDTLILGAGASGLAAAARLGAAGQSVCLLEARARIGGRIHSAPAPHLPLPLELGAEFIHGRSQEVLAWLGRGGAAAIDVPELRWTLTNGHLRDSDDLFEQMKSGLDALKRPRKDLSLGAFLDGPARRRLSPRVRAFARMLVEGFDAADADRVSTHAILDEWSGGASADAPTFRPLQGYGALLGALHAAIDPSCVTMHLQSIVTDVQWRRGCVTVQGTRHGQAFSVRAKRAIVTLPLGVLHAPPGAIGAVRFAPEVMPLSRALAGLAAGPVIKVLLHFREPFWENLDGGRYRDATFFQAPGEVFTTFWSSLPARTAVLTAWSAGPNAARLAGLSRDEIVQRACASVQVLFSDRVRPMTSLLGAWVHDWQSDPFARGAYSYVLAGGGRARGLLATPVERTLFFAGEATDDDEAATVSGAVRSGERAARQVLAA